MLKIISIDSKPFSDTEKIYVSLVTDSRDNFKELLKLIDSIVSNPYHCEDLINKYGLNKLIYDGKQQINLAIYISFHDKKGRKKIMDYLYSEMMKKPYLDYTNIFMMEIESL